MPPKKYKLKCFRCGYQFWDKNEVFRDNFGYPICGQCIADLDANDMQYYEEKKRWNDWKKNKEYCEKRGILPPPDPDEQDLLDALVRKYGEC